MRNATGISGATRQPGGGPPNNWLSEFGGPAWAFDERTGQYYYHAFLAAQPDLNWRNAEVRAVMHDAMRFWLRKGVDGFRVDVMWHLIKDAAFRDNPPNPDYREGDPPYRRLLPLYSTDRPEVHDVVRGLRAVIDEFPARVLIGEIYLPVERLVAYYGRDLCGAHLPFNFSLLETPWRASAIAQSIDRYEAALPVGGWPNWVLGNHDRPRLATRTGPEQARVAAMLLLTLRGTPTLYYGDEIGMRQVAMLPEAVRDPAAPHVPGRDGARTPMQWDGSAFAGFSTAEPLASAGGGFHRQQRRSPARRAGLAAQFLQTADRLAPCAAGSVAGSLSAAPGRWRGFGLHAGGGGRAGSGGAEFRPPRRPPWFCRSPGTVLLSSEAGRDGEEVRHSLALRPHDGAIVALRP